MATYSTNELRARLSERLASAQPRLLARITRGQTISHMSEADKIAAVISGSAPTPEWLQAFNQSLSSLGFAATNYANHLLEGLLQYQEIRRVDANVERLERHRNVVLECDRSRKHLIESRSDISDPSVSLLLLQIFDRCAEVINDILDNFASYMTQMDRPPEHQAIIRKTEFAIIAVAIAVVAIQLYTCTC